METTVGSLSEQPPAIVRIQLATGCCNNMSAVHPSDMEMHKLQGSLDSLASSKKIYIRQRVEMLEVISGLEGANRYNIYNEAGELIFLAQEETEFCTRMCCGSGRPFSIGLYNPQATCVLRFDRPYHAHFSCLCCRSCLDEVSTLDMASGQVLGRVIQKWHLTKPTYMVTNASGNEVAKIVGPHYCNCRCFRFEFPLFTPDGQVKVGFIKKKFSGFTKEVLTDADNFTVQFPSNATIEDKGVLIGAVLLIDFMFFEDNRGSSWG